MTTNYRRGYAFELRVKKYFESKGFFVVRSSGSHGEADLICFQINYDRPPILLQCKRHGAMSLHDKAVLYKLASSIFCHGVIAFINKRKKMVLLHLDSEADSHEFTI